MLIFYMLCHILYIYTQFRHCKTQYRAISTISSDCKSTLIVLLIIPFAKHAGLVGRINAKSLAGVLQCFREEL